MKASDRKAILGELGWLTDDPALAVNLLTDDEARDIVKRGYVTKALWESLQARMKGSSNG